MSILLFKLAVTCWIFGFPTLFVGAVVEDMSDTAGAVMGLTGLAMFMGGIGLVFMSALNAMWGFWA